MSTADRLRSRALLALVVMSVAVIVTGTVVGVVSPGAALGGSDETGSHADPASVSSERDLTGLERQMADRLASRARSGSLNISRENRQQAREALSDSQYEALLNRYSEVANETGAVDRAVAFRRVRANQVALTTAVDRYWSLYAQYEGTRNGTYSYPQYNNTSRRAVERNLARQLESEWRTIEESRNELVTSQRRLANVTGENVTASLVNINESVREVNVTQQEVRDEQFIETRLAVEVDDSQVSFREPLEIRGQLRTESGDPIANESASFVVGNQTLDTSTNGTGGFDLAYRPTTIPSNATDVTVRYVAERQSLYLGDERSVPVSVTPVEPEITVEVAPGQAKYNETVQVSGRIGTAEAGVANVSYLVSLGNRVLAANRTAQNGTFTRNVSIPASVKDGQQPVRVFAPFDKQALRSANGSTTLDIAATDTTLDATAERSGEGTIRVSGSLATGDGEPVPDQSVTVRANGTVLGTISTGPDGTFDTQLSIPSDVGSAGPFDSISTIGLSFQFRGTGTNLRGASADASVTLSSPPVGLWAGGAVAVLGALAVLLLAVRKVRQRQTDDDESRLGRASVTLDTGHTVSKRDTETLVERARDRLASDRPQEAARIGYLALRQQCTDVSGDAAGQTPWEFYEERADSELGETTRETLQRATELYERARFDSAGEPLPARDVEALLSDIGELLSRSEPAD